MQRDRMVLTGAVGFHGSQLCEGLLNDVDEGLGWTNFCTGTPGYLVQLTERGPFLMVCAYVTHAASRATSSPRAAPAWWRSAGTTRRRFRPSNRTPSGCKVADRVVVGTRDEHANHHPRVVHLSLNRKIGFTRQTSVVAA